MDSTSSSNVPRRLLRALGFVALWTLVGLAFAGQFYLSSSLLGRTVSWGQAISYALGDWYVWAVLSLPVIRFARRYPPEAGVSWRIGCIHLGAALVCSLAYVLLRAAVGQMHGWVIDEPVTFGEVFRPLLVKTFPFNLLIYGVIVSVSHAIDYYRKYHERTVQALELEKHLTEARLQSLLRQLKPHFLFNSLNGIASLMYSDVAAADKMLVRLSELLRLSMSHSGSPLAPLRDEVAFLEKYLEIERLRFRDRLEFRMTIDPATLDAAVPSLVLQPIVENAIRHGIEPHARQGRIELRAARAGEELVLTVTDNGAGMPVGGFAREGIGVANTRARLAELYGPRHRFAFNNRPEGGLCVTIAIPFVTNAEKS
jgi:signal transduction histidine kinase